MDITNAQEFAAMRQGAYTDTSFVLTADIDLTGCDLSAVCGAISAEFDGRGHSISGARVNVTSAAGTWALLSFSEDIKNVKVRDIRIGSACDVNIIQSAKHIESSVVTDMRIKCTKYVANYTPDGIHELTYGVKVFYGAWGVRDSYAQGEITAKYAAAWGGGSTVGCMSNIRYIRAPGTGNAFFINAGLNCCAVNDVYIAPKIAGCIGNAHGYSAGRLICSSEVGSEYINCYYKDAAGFYDSDRVVVTGSVAAKGRQITNTLSGAALTSAEAKAAGAIHGAGVYMCFGDGSVQTQTSHEAQIADEYGRLIYHFTSWGTLGGLRAVKAVRATSGAYRQDIDFRFFGRSSPATGDLQTVNITVTDSVVGDVALADPIQFAPGDSLQITQTSNAGLRWGDEDVNTGVYLIGDIPASGLILSGQSMYATDPALNEGYPYIKGFRNDVSAPPSAAEVYYVKDGEHIPCEIYTRKEGRDVRCSLDLMSQTSI